MRYRFTEGSFAAPAVLMSTPGGYPPSNSGYQGPPPGYVPPPSSGQPAGLSSNAASVLAYAFGIISGVIFLVLEPYKRDPLVRFSAFQSIFYQLTVIVFFIVWNLLAGLLDALTHGIFLVVHLPLNLLLWLGFVAVWIILMVRAGQGRKWVLPVIGPFAEKQAGTVSF